MTNQEIMGKHQFPYIESLLTLFILFACFSFFIICDDYKNVNAVTAYRWSKYTADILPFEVHPEREFITIEIGDQPDNLIPEHWALLVRQITTSRDTVQGIRFHFTPEAKYESLIKVIDIIYHEKPRFYMWKDSDIWICNTSEADRQEMQSRLKFVQKELSYSR